MKYLKKFKESKEEYYVNFDTSKLEKKEFINISDRSVYYIKEFLGVKFNYRLTSLYPGISNVDKYIMIYEVSGGNERLKYSIMELEDEYFIVHVYKGKLYSNTYKCDQIDGVLELLKDLN